MTAAIQVGLSYAIIRAVEAGEVSAEDFERRVLRTSRNLDRIEKSAAVDVKKALRVLDRNIRDAVTSATDREELSRGDINAIIDREVDRFAEERRRIMQGATQKAVDAAQDFRQGIARIAKQPAPAAPVDEKIARDIFEIHDQSNRGLADNLRARLKKEVADGVVAGKTPNQIAADIVKKRIAAPTRKAGDESARGALAQVEKLTRTEVRQVFNAANFSGARAEQGVRPGTLKSWITQMDAKVRETHIRAGRVYAVGSKQRDGRGRSGPIPVHEKFQVGEAFLQFPVDPSGPPEETANCRCVSVEIIPEVAEKIES